MNRVILVCRFSGGRGIVNTEVLYVHIQLVIIRDCSFTKDLWSRGTKLSKVLLTRFELLLIIIGRHLGFFLRGNRGRNIDILIHRH